MSEPPEMPRSGAQSMINRSESGRSLAHSESVCAGQRVTMGGVTDGSGSVKTHGATVESPPSGDAEILPIWLRNRRRLILLRRDDARATLARRWLKGRRRPASAVTYAYEIEAFFEWCDQRGLDVLDLDREHIDDYRQELDGRFEDSTIAKRLSALSSFYRFALNERRPIVENNPTARVERPRLSRDSRTAGLDSDEVRRFLSAAASLPVRERAVVFVLYACGVRISELCGARASGLRTVQGHLQMEVKRKGGKTSWVTMRPEAAVALTDYLDGRTDGPLFLGFKDHPISRHEVAGILSDLVKAAEIEGKNITPHSMRHTYATMALNAGSDIRDVQESMGHSSIESTMRYNRARTTVERAPTHKLTWIGS